ncbi:MAG: hypothetical protein AAF958_14355 [Planctomycetota bacterium]
MFNAVAEHIEPNRVTRYRILDSGEPLSYAAVLDLLQFDSAFRGFFTAQLAKSPFPGYRWETPAITDSTVGRPFEFVLIHSPSFCQRQTDAKTYADYFTDSDSDDGIVTFLNLRGDSTLVVPSPRAADTAYGHLAAFFRHAPPDQVDSIWRVLAAKVKSRLGSQPIWVSSAGGGVAWLHIRLDSRPKYYAYTPYRTV